MRRCGNRNCRMDVHMTSTRYCREVRFAGLGRAGSGGSTMCRKRGKCAWIVIVTVMLFLRSPSTMHFLKAQDSKDIAGRSADRRAIQALVTKLVAASNANDMRAFADVFAADADFTNVFGQYAKGRSEIYEFHAP